MGEGIGVTALTFGGGGLVLLGWVAADAAHKLVFAIELEAIGRFGIVVIEGDLAGRTVAALALETQAAIVRVVF